MSKAQFDTYVRRFRTEAAKNQHCEELWKVCSARVSWERETRKGRKIAQVNEFFIVGPQLAVDEATFMIQSDIELQDAEKQATAKTREKAAAAAAELAAVTMPIAQVQPGRKRDSESQAEPEPEPPIEPAHGPPPARKSTEPATVPSTPVTVPFNATCEELRHLCTRQLCAILESEKFDVEDTRIAMLTLPVQTVARIVRRAFPTLRHTQVIVQSYRSVSLTQTLSSCLWRFGQSVP